MDAGAGKTQFFSTRAGAGAMDAYSVPSHLLASPRCHACRRNMTLFGII